MVWPVGHICVSVASVALLATCGYIYHRNVLVKEPTNPDIAADLQSIAADCGGQIFKESVEGTLPEILPDELDAAEGMIEQASSVGSFELVNLDDLPLEERVNDEADWHMLPELLTMPKAADLQGWSRLPGYAEGYISRKGSSDSGSSIVVISEGDPREYMPLGGVTAGHMDPIPEVPPPKQLSPLHLDEPGAIDMKQDSTDSVLGTGANEQLTDSVVWDHFSPCNMDSQETRKNESVDSSTVNSDLPALPEGTSDAPNMLRGGTQERSENPNIETQAPLHTDAKDDTTCMVAGTDVQPSVDPHVTDVSQEPLRDTSTSNTNDGLPSYEEALNMVRVQPISRGFRLTAERKLHEYVLRLSELRYIVESIVKMHSDHPMVKKGALSRVLHHSMSALKSLEAELLQALSILGEN
ncbi:hypothetical protein BBOV_I002460 [Babesia bovis T2Bo]|uniref:Uncharacterized protein n=1 Tax=Babesia bovis TaxID=5865 RepID=A7AWA0_BABBO|nr:hypothetical protein BBOV_I002460 [Babesia bovis T2Bo]EDO05328.1 hypothetical protein BBOV_I002460 [Babesia bovis T2Bo]|eukprot:XP_001608896.1 hypothetical protein [Babesia bovis T2Bo]